MLTTFPLRVIYIPPLFFVAVGSVLSIACSACLPSIIGLSLLLILTMISYIFFSYNSRQMSKAIFYCLLGMAAGTARYSYLEYRFKADCAWLQNIHSLKGEIISRIDRLEYPRRTQLIISSSELGSFLANTRDLVEVLPGDTIMLTNTKFKPLSSNKFTTYLRSKDCISSIHFKNENLQLINRPFFSFKRFFFITNARLLNAYQQLLSKQTLTCFYALFLGNKQLFQKSFNRIKGRFNNWGLAHFLARSGLHLVMFIAIWITLLRLVPLGFFIKQFLLLLLVLLYLLFSWSSIPFTRAMIAFVYQSGCSLVSLQTHPLQTISLVALLLLLCNPYQLFLLEFQLTMSLTFGLLWFYWKSKHLS